MRAIGIYFANAPWLEKTIAELTLEDAMMASKEGFHIVCGDGKAIAITNEKGRTTIKGGR